MFELQCFGGSRHSPIAAAWELYKDKPCSRAESFEFRPGDVKLHICISSAGLAQSCCVVLYVLLAQWESTNKTPMAPR
jgi:hypothetical protein